MLKTKEEAQAAGIGEVAIVIAEKIGCEIICAEKDKWLTAIQNDIDNTPKIKLSKHAFLSGLKFVVEEVVAMCDCPPPTPPAV